MKWEVTWDFFVWLPALKRWLDDQRCSGKILLWGHWEKKVHTAENRPKQAWNCKINVCNSISTSLCVLTILFSCQAVKWKSGWRYLDVHSSRFKGLKVCVDDVGRLGAEALLEWMWSFPNQLQTKQRARNSPDTKTWLLRHKVEIWIINCHNTICTVPLQRSRNTTILT